MKNDKKNIENVVSVLSNKELNDLLSCLAFASIGEACIPNEDLIERSKNLLSKFAKANVKLAKDVEFCAIGGFENESDELLVKAMDGKIVE